MKIILDLPYPDLISIRRWVLTYYDIIKKQVLKSPSKAVHFEHKDGWCMTLMEGDVEELLKVVLYCPE